LNVLWDTDLLFSVTDKYDGACLFTSTDDQSYGKNIVGINPVLNFTDIDVLESFLRENRSASDTPLVLGHIAYDFKDRLEDQGLYKNVHERIFPEFQFTLYEYYMIADNSDRTKIDLIRMDIPRKYDRIDPGSIFKVDPVRISGGKSVYKGSSLTKEQYQNSVSKIRDYILKGDIYQANLTRKITAETDLTPVELAVRLKNSNSIGFGVFAKSEGKYVISTSPERFLKTDNGILTSSPIKGTVERSDDEQKDIENLDTLLNSQKELAELAMIVDLIRNDMNKVCTGVEVKEFPAVMKLRNVYHLYSDVTGMLVTNKFSDIIAALFPGGSITGCPKIRACQIIEELEGIGRGLYTGNYGYVSFNGNMDFNIMIRTLFCDKGNISFNAGGGITLLSDPENEYKETIHKAKNIYDALNMEEIWEERYCLTEK